MDRIPEEIRRHRLPGTEIKKIGARYYIQRITSKRQPGSKWPRKVVLGYIGTVTPEGIVPKKTKRIPADVVPRTKVGMPPIVVYLGIGTIVFPWPPKIKAWMSFVDT